MDKNTYIKIKNTFLICLVVFFCFDKISEFYSEDILDKIIFYDLPDSDVQLQTIEEGVFPASEDIETDMTRNMSADQSKLIDINTADAEQLQLLNKIGPVLASRIIEYRESYGAFVNIEEIKEVKGIGEKIFESIKDSIAVYP